MTQDRTDTTPATPTPEEKISSEKVAAHLEEMNSFFKYASDIKLSLYNRFARIDRIMTPLLNSAPMGKTVDTIAQYKIAVDDMESEIKEFKNLLSYALEVTVPERMKAEEIKTFNTDDFRVTRTSRIFASIRPEKLEDAYSWLRNNEYGSIIKETVNASSLSAVAKELVENGKELPEKLFRSHYKDGTSVTKKR